MPTCNYDIAIGTNCQAIYFQAEDCIWGTIPDESGSYPDTSGGFYDKLDFLSESMNFNIEVLDDTVLAGRASKQCESIISEIAGGSISMKGSYIRIGRILAHAMGLEHPDSPTGAPNNLHWLELTDNLSSQNGAQLADQGYDMVGHLDKMFNRKGHLWIHKVLPGHMEKFFDCMVNTLAITITSENVVFNPTFICHSKSLGNETAQAWRDTCEDKEKYLCQYLEFGHTSFILQEYDGNVATFDTTKTVRYSEITLTINNNLSSGALDSISGIHNPEPVRAGKRSITLAWTSPRFQTDESGALVDFSTEYHARTRMMGRIQTTHPVTGDVLYFMFSNLKIRSMSNNVAGGDVLSVSYECELLCGLECVEDWKILFDAIDSGGSTWKATGFDDALYAQLRNAWPWNYLRLLAW